MIVTPLREFHWPVFSRYPTSTASFRRDDCGLRPPKREGDRPGGSVERKSYPPAPAPPPPAAPPIGADGSSAITSTCENSLVNVT